MKITASLKKYKLCAQLRKFIVSKLNISRLWFYYPLMGFWVDENYKIEGTGIENNAVLVFGDDDTHISQYTFVYPLLLSKGFKGTCWVCTKRPGVEGSTISPVQLKIMQENGWCMSPHSHYHGGDPPPYDEEYQNLSDEEIRADLNTCLGKFAEWNIIPSTNWTPPRFSSWYSNVRRIGAEFFNGIRMSIYAHNMHWDRIDRCAIGVFPASMTTDQILINAKHALDIAVENKTILIVYGHSYSDGDGSKTRYTEFINYADSKGIEVITFDELYDRIMAHQGYYIDQSRKIPYLTKTYEHHKFEGYSGHIIFNCTLERLGVHHAERIKNNFNYLISFYKDTSDEAFAYAVPDNNFRAYLQSINIKCVYDLMENTTVILYANKPTEAGNIANYGFYYFVNRVSFTVSNLPKLAGNIPRSICSMIRMQYIRIVATSISGSIPIEFNHLVDLYYLQMNNNKLTGYEKGAFGKELSRLSYINLQGNALTVQAVNDILCDVRDMVALQKNYPVTYEPTHYYKLYLDGGTNATPSGDGITAKTQLQNAIIQLGGMVNWTVVTN